MRVTIGIVDYGLGNVGSIQAAFSRLGVRSILSDKAAALAEVDGLVLPGVGAFPAAMEQIRSKGLDGAIHDLVIKRQKALLGICLGMQILADLGEEYVECRGLGLIPGRVRRIQPEEGRKVPHVGWSEVRVCPCGNDIFCRMAIGDAYYFDHSYYFDVSPKFLAAVVKADQGVVAAVVRDRVWGVQFHPEKSQNAGLRLLRAFCMMAEQGGRL
jgi:glutamine amidotransferase